MISSDIVDGVVVVVDGGEGVVDVVFVDGGVGVAGVGVHVVAV